MGFTHLQTEWTPDWGATVPRPLCPLSSTEFVEPLLPSREHSFWIRHCWAATCPGNLLIYYPA
jgi:hypothetical protein